MADRVSLSSPTDDNKKPRSSFFNSPRLFTGFSVKGFSETEAMMSPTSILDNKPFSVLENSILSDRNSTKSPETCLNNKHPWEKLDSKGIGLGIIESLNDEQNDKKFFKPNSRMILFGSQLKIQIPPLPLSTDFGIKTRNSQLGFPSPVLSPSSANKSASGSSNSGLETPSSPLVFNGYLSPTEMELSEDYTCVISHGPNPKTTHIFDNCIVESCCGILGLSDSMKGNFSFSDRSQYSSGNFLSFCYTCKKDLGQGKDIYIYRGDKGFCSNECRYREMLIDEGMEKLESEDVLRSSGLSS